jgi:mono/diheme cytochrome c family protein
MRHCNQDFFSLGTISVVGLWALWNLPGPLLYAHRGSVVPAAPATAPQPQVVARRVAKRPSHSAVARELYSTRCARCHEADGRGTELHEAVREAPDFTNLRWHLSRSTDELIVSILDGKGTRMPAFGGKLTTAEARDLVVYLRSFAPELPTVHRSSPDDFETRFQELEEEFQRLKQQLDEVSRKRK